MLHSTTPQKMKINKISKKLIKPQTPTPQNLKIHNISFVDQFIQPMNIAVILFYHPKLGNDGRLENSLAETLVDFYPLAGRYIKHDHIVDCSDAGAEFVEAEAHGVDLIDLVSKIEADHLSALLPDTYFRCDEAAGTPLLSIQATRFRSGGAAVAVSVSHRVFDVSSLGMFVAAWSSAAASNRRSIASELTPDFQILPSLLPYLDLDLASGSGSGSNDFTMDARDVFVKRLVFDKNALDRLRSELSAKNAGAGAAAVSGVRIACAAVAGALILLDRRKHEGIRDLLVFQMINMRERTVPPTRQACGNFAFPSQPRRVAAAAAEAAGIKELVDLIGDSLRKSITEYAGILAPDNDGRGTVMKALGSVTKEIFTPDTNVLAFTDWSKFGFHEADFGWGRPVWAGIGPTRPCVSTAVLMSDGGGGGGIEVWLHLNKDDMSYLEQDEEMKMFAT